MSVLVTKKQIWLRNVMSLCLSGAKIDEVYIAQRAIDMYRAIPETHRPPLVQLINELAELFETVQEGLSIYNGTNLDLIPASWSEYPAGAM